MDDWPIIDPLPSYGRGRDAPGGRHSSLIMGFKLKDVIITGTVISSKPYHYSSFNNNKKICQTLIYELLRLASDKESPFSYKI